jgi:ATP-dependent protease HslVU (ClpYQ) peptidase subunit
MTCIIGLKKAGSVVIGADSAGVSGWDIRQRKDSKVFIKSDMIFGFTSSFRMGQIIQHSFVIPKHYEKSDFEYMCSDFIDALRKTLKEKGFSKIKDNTEEGGTFLVGYKGELYKIESDYQVAQILDDFDACGCGEAYALGAMAVLKDNDTFSPEEKVKKALEIAEHFSAGVRSPFFVLTR